MEQNRRPKRAHITKALRKAALERFEQAGRICALCECVVGQTQEIHLHQLHYLVLLMKCSSGCGFCASRTTYHREEATHEAVYPIKKLDTGILYLNRVVSATLSLTYEEYTGGLQSSWRHQSRRCDLLSVVSKRAKSSATFGAVPKDVYVYKNSQTLCPVTALQAQRNGTRRG